MFVMIFELAENQPLIMRVWSMEFITLLIVFYTTYLTSATKNLHIKSLINEGIQIMSYDDKVSPHEEKTFKIFLIKTFIIDLSWLVPLLSNISLDKITSDVNYSVVTVFVGAINFMCTFKFQSFNFIIAMITFEVDKINRSMQESVESENFSSFTQDVLRHKRLQNFTRKVIGIFSKVCLANFLYAFTTTLSGVSEAINASMYH
jgi:hypothetical protein